MSDETAVVVDEASPRVDHLREMLSALSRRMRACDSDQNFTIMARERRAILSELEDMGVGEMVEKPETGLSEFERRLRERQVSA